MKKEVKVYQEYLELLVTKAQYLADVLPEPHSESTSVVSRAWNIIGTIDVIKNHIL